MTHAPIDALTACCRLISSVDEYRRAREKRLSPEACEADRESEDSAFHEMIHRAMEAEIEVWALAESRRVE